MFHQMDTNNYCHGRYYFRGFGRNRSNGMMNTFENRWFIAIIGQVDCLAWTESIHLYSSAEEKISLELQRKMKQTTSAVDAAKQFYKTV